MRYAKYLLLACLASGVSSPSYAADAYLDLARKYSAATQVPQIEDFEKWNPDAKSLGKICKTASKGTSRSGATVVRAVYRAGQAKVLLSGGLFIPLEPVAMRIRCQAMMQNDCPDYDWSPSDMLGIRFFFRAYRKAPAPRSGYHFDDDYRAIGEIALSNLQDYARTRDQTIDELYDSSDTTSTCDTSKNCTELSTVVNPNSRGFYDDLKAPVRITYKKMGNVIYFKSVTASKNILYGECP